MNRKTISSHTRTPREIDDEISRVQVKLQTLTEVLKLYGDNSTDTSAEGFCDLVTLSIEDARSILCDISQALQAIELNRSTEQGALEVVKRELAATPTD